MYFAETGPGSSFSKPADPELCPSYLADYSYIVFECKYPGKLPLPFRMLGDCPVVVTAILHNTIKTGSNHDRDNNSTSSPGGASTEGTLIDVQGAQAEWLHAFGLFPALGDVLVEIDGTVVTHLNSNQCKRLVKRKRAEIRNFLAGRAFVDLNDEPMITVRFRRHFLEVSFAPAAVSENQSLALMDSVLNTSSMCCENETECVPSGQQGGRRQ